jgi:hypothetical protein
VSLLRSASGSAGQAGARDKARSAGRRPREAKDKGMVNWLCRRHFNTANLMLLRLIS